jgi:hypothetical protein
MNIPTGPYVNIKLDDAIKSLVDYHAVAPSYVMIDHNKDIFYLPEMHAESKKKGLNSNYIYDSNDSLFEYSMKLHPNRMDKYFTPKKLDEYLDTRIWVNTSGKEANGIRTEKEYQSLQGFMLPGYERIISEDTPYSVAKYNKDGLIKYSEKTLLSTKLRSFLVFKKKERQEFVKDFVHVLNCNSIKSLADEKCKFWCKATNDIDMKAKCQRGEHYE